MKRRRGIIKSVVGASSSSSSSFSLFLLLLVLLLFCIITSEAYSNDGNYGFFCQERIKHLITTSRTTSQNTNDNNLLLLTRSEYTRLVTELSNNPHDDDGDDFDRLPISLVETFVRLANTPCLEQSTYSELQFSAQCITLDSQGSVESFCKSIEGAIDNKEEEEVQYSSSSNNNRNDPVDMFNQQQRRLQEFQECKTDINIGDTNRDNVLEKGEYVKLLNRLSDDDFEGNTFDELPDRLKVYFDETKEGGGSGIDVTGSKPSQTPTDEQEEFLENFCNDLRELLDATESPVEPDTTQSPVSSPTTTESCSIGKQSCYINLSIADSDRDSQMDEKEYVDFVNRLSNGNYAGVEFEDLPGNIKDTFYGFLQNGKIDLTGSKPGQVPSENQEKMLIQVCCQTKFAIENPFSSCDNTISREKCNIYMSIADLSKDNYLDKTEYIRFLNLLSDNPFQDLPFDFISDDLIKNFNRFARDSGGYKINIYGSKPGQTVSTAQDEALDAFCCATDLAIDTYDPGSLSPTDRPSIAPVDVPTAAPTISPTNCRLLLRSSDFNEDNYLNQEEFVRFINRVSENEFQNLQFENLNCPLQETYSSLTSNNGEIYIFGLDFILQVCSDVSMAIIASRTCVEPTVSPAPTITGAPTSTPMPTTSQMPSLSPTLSPGECRRVLRASDFNEDNYLNQEEYLRFVNRLSGNDFRNFTFEDLPCPIPETYTSLAGVNNTEIYISGIDFMNEICSEVFSAIFESPTCVKPTISPAPTVTASPSMSPMPTGSARIDVYNSFVISNSDGLKADDLFNNTDIRDGLDRAYDRFARDSVLNFFQSDSSSRRVLQQRRLGAAIVEGSPGITEILDSKCPSELDATNACQTLFASFQVTIEAMNTTEIIEESLAKATQIEIESGVLQVALKEELSKTTLNVIEASYPVRACPELLSLSDINQDGLINQGEFIGFVNHLVNDLYQDFQFDDLPCLLPEVFGTLAAANDEINISDGTGSQLEVCAQVTTAISQEENCRVPTMSLAPSISHSPTVSEEPSSIPSIAPSTSEPSRQPTVDDVKVYNSFIMANEKGIKADGLGSGLLYRTGLENAYSKFASDSVYKIITTSANDTQSQRSRNLEVLFVPDSPAILLIQDTDCPPNIVLPLNCQIAFANFQVTVKNEDAEGISSSYTNATQQEIENGELQSLLKTIDPSTVLTILNASYPVTYEEVAPTSSPQAPTQAPVAVEEKGSPAGAIVGWLFGAIFVLALVGWYYKKQTNKQGTPFESDAFHDEPATNNTNALSKLKVWTSKVVSNFGARKVKVDDEQANNYGFGGTKNDVETGNRRSSGENVVPKANPFVKAMVWLSNVRSNPKNEKVENGDKNDKKDDDDNDERDDSVGTVFEDKNPFDEAKDEVNFDRYEFDDGSSDSDIEKSDEDGSDESSEESEKEDLFDSNKSGFSENHGQTSATDFFASSTFAQNDTKSKEDDGSASENSEESSYKSDGSDSQFEEQAFSSSNASANEDDRVQNVETVSEDSTDNEDNEDDLDSKSSHSESNASNSARANYRAEIEALVREVLPAQVDKIDVMMGRFKYREPELIATLRNMQDRSTAQNDEDDDSSRGSVASAGNDGGGSEYSTDGGSEYSDQVNSHGDNENSRSYNNSQDSRDKLSTIYSDGGGSEYNSQEAGSQGSYGSYDDENSRSYDSGSYRSENQGSYDDENSRSYDSRSYRSGSYDSRSASRSYRSENQGSYDSRSASRSYRSENQGSYDSRSASRSYRSENQGSYDSQEAGSQGSFYSGSYGSGGDEESYYQEETYHSSESFVDEE